MKRFFVLTVLSVMLAAMTLVGAPVSEAATGNVVWNTFYGSIYADYRTEIAHDSAGNIYITGMSNATWGTPIRSFGENDDAFVARLTPNGEMVWSTFLGGSGFDGGFGIAVDGNSNVIVTGYSSQTWGTPISPCSGDDAFVAKLNSNGALLWNTFVGGMGSEEVRSIALDLKGRPYISGRSTKSWGTPVRAFTGPEDAFVARLSPNGVLNWHTFLGGTKIDQANDIVVSAGGAAYVTGWSQSTWGTPLRAYTDYEDVFVAKVGSHGVLKWNTFLGDKAQDVGTAIALDHRGVVYTVGVESGRGPFLAKLGQDGVIRWNNTFGSGGPTDIVLDSARNIYVAGSSSESWGNPVRPFTNMSDGFAAQFNANGELKWNTFVGGNQGDDVFGITRDANGNVYVSGQSFESWGTPKHPFTGGMDAFVAKIE